MFCRRKPFGTRRTGFVESPDAGDVDRIIGFAELPVAVDGVRHLVGLILNGAAAGVALDGARAPHVLQLPLLVLAEG